MNFISQKQLSKIVFLNAGSVFFTCLCSNLKTPVPKHMGLPMIIHSLTPFSKKSNDNYS